MLKVVAAARRRPGMTHEEYLRYVQDVHGELARARPLGLARYVQNHVFDGAFGSDSDNDHAGVFHRDSVTELFFKSPDDMRRTFEDEYTRTVIVPDGPNFAELKSTLALLTVEEILAAPQPTSAKILQFLYDGNDGKGGDSQSRWRTAHERALNAAPRFARALQGLALSVPARAAPGDGGLAAHFGSAQDGCCLQSSYWISRDELAAFRPYEHTLVSEGGFDPRRSFFLCATEVTIL